ncbi:hypothetical protein ZHAS_00013977 [Anopheles sinensis]|uniref:Uncharacterized protein n=1 Tax=Anopheles sinensis TaxID=74873 RepID=A0A084W714_ANOSI|nr:hypothetical protein ZHAS_00013977 [Anopheles sinensis]
MNKSSFMVRRGGIFRMNVAAIVQRINLPPPRKWLPFALNQFGHEPQQDAYNRVALTNFIDYLALRAELGSIFTHHPTDLPLRRVTTPAGGKASTIDENLTNVPLCVVLYEYGQKSRHSAGEDWHDECAALRPILAPSAVNQSVRNGGNT